MRISDWSSNVCSSDLRQARSRRARQQRIGADPILGLSAVAIEQHRAVDELRARRPAHRRFFEPRRGIGALAVLEQREAVILLGLIMALLGGLAIPFLGLGRIGRSEEHTSELQSLMRISYAVFCLK